MAGKMREYSSFFVVLLFGLAISIHAIPVNYYTTDDTYIANGDATPHGYESTLLYNYTKWALVKFSIKGIDTCVSAKFRFYNLAATAITGQLWRCPTRWKEATAVYSQLPNWKTSVISTFSGNIAGFIELDVSQVVRDSMHRTDSIALLICWKSTATYSNSAIPSRNSYYYDGPPPPCLIVDDIGIDLAGNPFWNIGQLIGGESTSDTRVTLSAFSQKNASTVMIQNNQDSGAAGIHFCDGPDMYTNLKGHIGIAGPYLHVPDLRQRAYLGSIRDIDFVVTSGDQVRMIVNKNGNVGIGTLNPAALLSVNGNIKAREAIVASTGWSDYVFSEGYPLKSLYETEHYITQNRHLEGVPSQKEVMEKGVSIAEILATLLAKIEELTLHQISMKKENDNLRSEIERLEASQ